MLLGQGRAASRNARPLAASRASRDWPSTVLLLVGAALLLGALVYGAVLGVRHWGTGAYTARANNALRSEFLGRLERAPAPVTAPHPVASPQLATPPQPAPPAFVPEGDVVALLRVPAIELDMAIVQGTSAVDLRAGPGHYVNTAMPWEDGRVGIAGHRTTYGAPFWDLDEVAPGDEIEVVTQHGTFTYEVTGSDVVGPHDTEVLAPGEGRSIVLTTCHPRGSATRRLVVYGELSTLPQPS